MTSIKEIKQKMLSYVQTLEDAEKRIPELEKRANAFIDQHERRQAIRERIAELEAQIEPLETELSGLQQPYLTALFNLDVPEQRKIQQTKKRLEGEIKRIEKALDDEYDKLDADPVDTEAVAELKAELDGFGLPASWVFTNDMRTEVEIPLQNAVSELQRRVDGIGDSVLGTGPRP